MELKMEVQLGKMLDDSMGVKREGMWVAMLVDWDVELDSLTD